ncbi:DUF2842 domain-containing protein [Roseomonas sp. CCTCC AB2023176]|uniref:DUF2842 domain-containing protein n=1 Tax=Roseomonas sp. CCTCC AB2023176 TaxID=3342640 RepID=UPI0035DF0270
MPRSTIAALVGVTGFLIYVVVVVALADAVIPTHWAFVALYFLVAGFAWTWPAIWLLKWAARRS